MKLKQGLKRSTKENADVLRLRCDREHLDTKVRDLETYQVCSVPIFIISANSFACSDNFLSCGPQKHACYFSQSMIFMQILSKQNRVSKYHKTTTIAL